MSLTPRPVLFPGILHDFGGGIKLMVPPLALGAVESLQDRTAALPTLTMMDPVAIATVVDATFMSLRRNYPDITRAEVADLVDVGNCGDVYECVMDVAGVKRKALQAAAAGNEQAPPEMGTAGAGSMPKSSPTPDGASAPSETS